MLMLAKAPREIKRLFELLVTDGLELTGYRKFKAGDRRQTTDEKLSKMLGLETTVPIRQMVADYFQA